MNHDVATESDSAIGRFPVVLLVWTRDVDRLVKAAFGVAAIEDVHTLRRLVISLLLLGAAGAPPRATL
jgi:hypothetical protein